MTTDLMLMLGSVALSAAAQLLLKLNATAPAARGNGWRGFDGFGDGDHYPLTHWLGDNCICPLANVSSRIKG